MNPVWLELAEKLACAKYDGHLTLMRWTTGWKAMFGTPNLDSGDGRDEVRVLPMHSTLEAALKQIIITELEK